MKWLFLFLLLANLILAAWGQFGRQTHPNPLTRQELHPELIRLAKPLPAPMPAAASMPAPAPAPLPASMPAPASAPAAALACYTWGPFRADAGDAEKAVHSASAQAQVRELPLSSASLGFWVYLPPAKSKSDAMMEIRKLDEMGIKDRFLVKESGKWQYAISLGIFHTKDAANNHAAMLKKKGLNSVRSGKRDGGEVELLIRSLRPAEAAKLAGFPNAKLSKIDCPATPGKASRD